jgi:hypothetical protein
MTVSLKYRRTARKILPRAVIVAGASLVLPIASGNTQTIVQSGGEGQNVIIMNGQRVDPVVAAGPDTSETRTLESFHAISINVPAQASFSIAATPSIRITTQANVLPVVTTRVEQGTLKINIQGAVTLHAPIRIEIAGPSPDAVSISGTAHFTANDLSSHSLVLSVNGNATIEASGAVEQLHAIVNGAGTIDTSAIHARAVDAEVSGTATMHAFASESAKVRISGVGSIHIAGQPAQRTVERNGLATVSFD